MYREVVCYVARCVHSVPHTPQVRQKLLNTRKRMEDLLSGVEPVMDDSEWCEESEELEKPLLAIYW